MSQPNSKPNSKPDSQAKSELAAWYVSRGGDATGPFSTDMLLAMLRNSQLQPLDLVFREGESEWRPVATYRELKIGAAVSEPQVSRAKPGVMPNVSSAPSKATVPAGQRGDPRILSWIVLRSHNSTFLQEGPLETQAIIDGLEKGRFQFSQYAWHEGMKRWMRIGDLREFDRRSRSRESKPHVPPPLPDPIAAVILEDDGDQEAEVFHVAMRGAFKHDLTPNPLESMLAITQLGNAAMGGAAAESPEQKASHAVSHVVSHVVSSKNLAGVPWEKDRSDEDVQAVEILNDQQSGVHTGNIFSDDDDDAFTFTASLDGTTSENESTELRLERTPHPFIPSGPILIPKEHWVKWGRHVVGAAMLGLLSFFGWHLVTYEKPPVAARLKTTPAAIVNDEFGKKSPDDGEPRNEMSSLVAAVVPIAAAPISPAVTASVATSAELGIFGFKLDQPEGQIVIQGSFPSNVPIELTFKGRLGQILSKMSVRKTVIVARKTGEIPSFPLKKLRLPTGSYTVEVKVGDAKTKNEFFIGSRDARFLDGLEKHLRDISLETQTQKKVLFYAAQEMNILARDLGQNYGQLRGKPQLWTSFYARWKQRMEMVRRSIADIGKKSVEDQAYPEETASLFQLQTSLKDVANQYEQSIGQSRDMASDTLTDLIAEITRQKDAIGQTTARPTANTPDGKM
jgi:hypothetical protein